MATRSQPKLLAQGKPRTLGGSTRPWRVRLYAPSPGSNKYQVFFKAPAGEVLSSIDAVAAWNTTTGSDTNQGTGPADAFKTIQKAIDTVQPGGNFRRSFMPAFSGEP